MIFVNLQDLLIPSPAVVAFPVTVPRSLNGRVVPPSLLCLNETFVASSFHFVVVAVPSSMVSGAS